jgi:hypothetical protein
VNLESRSKNYEIYLKIFFVFVAFFAFWASVFYFHKGNFDISLFIKWDAVCYYTIADCGYFIDNPEFHENVGWFPFYPIVIRLFSHFVRLDYAMVFVSASSFLLSLILLQRLVSSKYSERSSFWAIAALCTFPTSFYFLLGFPYSLFLLLSLSVFLLLEQNRASLSAVFESLLLITYPSGVLIYIPKIYFFIRNKKYTAKNLFLLIIPSVSVFIYFLYYKFAYGDFLLYVTFQSRSYGHHLVFPLLTIIETLNINDPFHNPESLIIILIIEYLLIFYNKIPTVYWLYGLSILMFTPMMGMAFCIYRHIIIAFPLFIVLTASDRHWIFKLTYCIISLMIGVIFYSKLYINDVLI